MATQTPVAYQTDFPQQSGQQQSGPQQCGMQTPVAYQAGGFGGPTMQQAPLLGVSDISEETDTTFIDWSQINPTRTRYSAPVEREIPFTAEEEAKIAAGEKLQRQYYKTVAVEYNYGTESEPRPDEFLFELPRLFSGWGVSTKFKKPTITVMINDKDPNMIPFLKKMEELYSYSAMWLEENRKAMGLDEYTVYIPGTNDFNLGMAKRTGFKYPIKPPMTKEKEVILGKGLEWQLKLGQWSNETKFVTPAAPGETPRPIDWKMLNGTGFYLTGVVRFKGLCKTGGGITMQVELVSAVVDEIRRKGKIANLSTVRRMAQANPNASRQVTSALEELRLEKEASRAAPPPLQSGEPSGKDGPSFDGVAPSGIPGVNVAPSQMPPASSQTTQQQTPSVPSQTPQQTLQQQYQQTPSFPSQTPQQQYQQTPSFPSQTPQQQYQEQTPQQQYQQTPSFPPQQQYQEQYQQMPQTNVANFLNSAATPSGFQLQGQPTQF